jgi:hypothetical protein
MMMAVYGGVAVVGQAMNSPSDKTVMIIHVFIVVLVSRVHITMSLNRGKSSVNL